MGFVMSMSTEPFSWRPSPDDPVEIPRAYMSAIREIFHEASVDLSWDIDQEIWTLLDFIEAESARDPLVRERFEAYLNQRLETAEREAMEGSNAPAAN
jgi:hypothetical protein